MRLLLTIRNDVADPNVIFSNGFSQNLKFFFELLELLGHEPYLLVADENRDGKVVLAGRNYPTVTYQRVRSEDVRYDIAFEGGCTINPPFRDYLRERFGTRVVSLRYGISMIMDMEQMSHHETMTGGLHFAGADWVWTSPHIAYGLPYLEVVYNAPGRVAPYIWEPDFVPRRFVSRGQMDVRDIFVMEPSISIIKHGLIPLTIIEELYRRSPDAFGKATILNGSHYNMRTYFLENVVRNFSSAIAEANKVFFGGRVPFGQVFKRPDLLLGHQWGCELNYLYLEALWAGLPLVHNSDALAEVGYHYPGFDVHAGTERCLEALRDHDEARSLARAEAFVQRYSIRNPEVQAGYRRLIDEVMDG